MEMRLVCPGCRSTKTRKIGFGITRKGNKQRWQCRNCGRTFYKRG